MAEKDRDTNKGGIHGEREWDQDTSDLQNAGENFTESLDDDIVFGKEWESGYVPEKTGAPEAAPQPPAGEEKTSGTGGGSDARVQVQDGGGDKQDEPPAVEPARTASSPEARIISVNLAGSESPAKAQPGFLKWAATVIPASAGILGLFFAGLSVYEHRSGIRNMVADLFQKTTVVEKQSAASSHTAQFDEVKKQANAGKIASIPKTFFYPGTAKTKADLSAPPSAKRKGSVSSSSSGAKAQAVKPGKVFVKINQSKVAAFMDYVKAETDHMRRVNGKQDKEQENLLLDLAATVVAKEKALANVISQKGPVNLEDMAVLDTARAAFINSLQSFVIYAESQENSDEGDAIRCRFVAITEEVLKLEEDFEKACKTHNIVSRPDVTLFSKEDIHDAIMSHMSGTYRFFEESLPLKQVYRATKTLLRTEDAKVLEDYVSSLEKRNSILRNYNGEAALSKQAQDSLNACESRIGNPESIRAVEAVIKENRLEKTGAYLEKMREEGKELLERRAGGNSARKAGALPQPSIDTRAFTAFRG